MTNIEWRPTATQGMLRRRADLLARIRQFFAERGVLEVETPILSHYANPDANIESFSTRPTPEIPVTYYLHTSPEFPMKRLLAAGSGPIYQICKVFRREPESVRHNPEFTMLEWYRPGWGYDALMGELADLIRHVGIACESEKLTYRDAFLRILGVDIYVATEQQLRNCATQAGIFVSSSFDDITIQGWLDLLFSHVVEPSLDAQKSTFVYEFPATAASLARIKSNDSRVAERFELFINGLEIANGYQELLDPDEQRRRWQNELEIRTQSAQELNPVDVRLLTALSEDIPPMSGVALGVDRLLMCLADKVSIRDVISFPASIA